MTRINVGVNPRELSNQHLIAEHREIKRIPNVIVKGKFNMDGIPENFKLGQGHVKFFYNKIGFLHDRYKSLLHECLERGFNVTDYNEPFETIKSLHPELYNDYIPTELDRVLILERIKSNKILKDLKKSTYATIY